MIYAVSVHKLQIWLRRSRLNQLWKAFILSSNKTKFRQPASKIDVLYNVVLCCLFGEQGVNTGLWSVKIIKQCAERTIKNAKGVNARSVAVESLLIIDSLLM